MAKKVCRMHRRENCSSCKRDYSTLSDSTVWVPDSSSSTSDSGSSSSDSGSSCGAGSGD